MKQEKRRENIVAGVVGAFLGTLVGVVCVIVLGQMGYVASISGLIMAVGALKGYELLGGTLSKKGAVISSVLILGMTYLAHRISCAVALSTTMGIGVLRCFNMVPMLVKTGAVESRAYWGDLVMLYLFTLLGAVPTIIGGLRSTSMPDLPEGAAAAAAQNAGTADAAFYPGDVKWMRPLRLSAALSMLVGLVPGVALLFVGMADDYALTPILGALGCVASCFIMMFAALPNVQLCYGAMLVMVRVNGTVWKVNLPMLNNADTYRFTTKTGAVRAIRWEILNEEERERAKTSILRAIALLSSGQVMAGSALSLAVLPLTNLQITEETKWKWKGVYSAGGGKEKKISIPKAYPGFAPAPGLEPAQEPAPAAWMLFGAAVLLAAVLGFVGAGFGYMMEGGVTGKPAGVKDTPAPAPTRTAEPTEKPTIEVDYQSLFHVGEELGYSYTGVAYIKAPDGMFETPGSFVDAHVPYSEEPVYLDGGRGVRSSAHGMEVTVNITRTDADAQAVVELAYDRMKAAGTDFMEDQVYDTHYFEEYDIAVKQVTYYEENRTKVRVAVLYADYKQDGYYLSAAIVYQPELMDEAYWDLLAELSDAYALNLPEIEPMDEI